MTVGPSMVFIRKAVVDETFNRILSIVCKSIVGTVPSQLYPFSMCQDMPTGLFTRLEFDTDLQKLKARHNRTCNFENLAMFFIKKQDQIVKLRAFLHLENRKKSTVLMWLVTAITVNSVRSNGMLLPLLFLSRSLSLLNRSEN